ncbi:hypothetical protein [Actinomyces bowdenii]|uniref:hypothetical protein n=1 Tax=Actinomyces bowdenii TaxID=131109 RepID=UPI001D16C099|nr:hypothetical protein [Actinomyces bowdenii]
MLLHAPSRRSALPSTMAELITLRSVVELPIVQRHALEAETLRRVAEVDRVGDLTCFNVAEVPELASLSDPSEFFSPDEHGWALGHALSHAVEHGQRLWLCEATPAQVEALRELLGEDLVHLANALSDQAGAASAPQIPQAGDPRGACGAGGAAPHDGTACVVALSPRALLDRWAAGGPEHVTYLRTVLEGTDPLRVSRHTLEALRAARVRLLPRSSITRLLHNPRFLAYATVFIYSSLRALPAALAPGFHGNPWVLWTIDIVTAVPYTWGIIAMVAGKRLRIRMLGLVITLITFIAPYLYFFARGQDYPPWVLLVVGLLVVLTLLLEGGRWLRDVGVARGVQAPSREQAPHSPAQPPGRRAPRE